MVLTVLQENLLKALTRTGRIVSPRPQLPILQNALLSTEDERLRVVAMNMETIVITWAGAKIEKEGGICVPSRLLTDLVSSLPQETVRLSIKDGGLAILCAGTNAVIPGVPSGEFPPLPKTGKGKAMGLEKEAVARALSAVLFSAATDEGRPILTGIKIQRQEDVVVFAATDGYRLSTYRVPLSRAAELNLVVPARALGEVFRVSQEEKDVKEVVLTLAEAGQLVFSVGDAQIITRTIDGEYPDFQKIIPTKHETRALLDREVLERAVKSAAIFARDNANIVRLHLENQALTVSASTPSLGQNTVEVDAKIDGEGGEIAFNSRFLLEFLASTSEEELLFEMTGSLNPGVFKPVKDESRLHIIMPVRVASG